MKTPGAWMGRVAAMIAGAVMLGSCAATPQVARTDETPHFFVDGLDVTAMTSVIKQGFDEIKARAYDDPDVDMLFLSALAGINSLDPALQLSISDNQLALNYQGAAPRFLTSVPHGDVAGWSRALVNAIVATRSVSPNAASADEETFYQLVFGAAVAKLDPFSRYASRRDAARNRLVRDGVIGLGVRVVAVADGAFIDAIVKEGPAEVAGVMINDIITTADGVKLARLPLADIRRYLDGSADTLVSLVIKRVGVEEPISIVARRDLIVPDTVTTTLRDGVAELRIRSFNQRTASAVSRAVTGARFDAGGKLKGVLLDLRGDPGGLLDQAVDMADLFLENGAIASLKGRHPASKQFYASHRGDVAQGAPIVIVVDGRTASAAEIVAAALQDNARAIIVGTVSLGKGSVQTVVRLQNGGELALTWSHATSPRGASLHGLGLLPDICLSGEPGPVTDIAARLVGDFQPSADTRQRWSAPATDALTHESLRAVCPAQVHSDRLLDIDVARLLLADPVMMARVTSGEGAQLAVKP